MRKFITKEQYLKLLKTKKNIYKFGLISIIFNLVLNIILLLLLQNIIIPITLFVLLEFFFTLGFIKLNKEVCLKMKYYNEQDAINLEKIEIQKLLKKFKDLLESLDVEKNRINYNLQKILNKISNADSLEDYKSITKLLKEKIIKYSKLLDDDSSYSYSQNFEYKDNYSSSFKKEKTELEENLEILGLKTPPKDKNDLKFAYRNMLKKYHPDNNQNNSNIKDLEEKTRQINIAYEYLIKVLYN